MPVVLEYRKAVVRNAFVDEPHHAEAGEPDDETHRPGEDFGQIGEHGLRRFGTADILLRLLADVGLDLREVAVIEGTRHLYGAKVEATDLRGAAALVTAALAAEGTSEITGVPYLERGYDGLEQTLTALGADVKKI